ncbi:MAG: 3-phosphoshikimate 1-carboxyvinyltransferase, partial [Candidatus Omnitrophica bacterium]|nr:3-phosphoshikimate 1-carboxyvinyltransferase [Candidatus Omnitrophota bacterium]
MCYGRSYQHGKTSIKNFPFNSDCLATVHVFQTLGVAIKQKKKAGVSCGTVVISGKGLRGLKKPSRPLVIKESGTTFRLLAGILAGQSFSVTLKAGKNLSRRPMLRITKPLRMMGAGIRAAKKKKNGIIEEYPPVIIHGGNLNSIVYTIPVASAQVKSSLMFAGLYARGATEIT